MDPQTQAQPGDESIPEVARHTELLLEAKKEMQRVVVGQDAMLDRLLVALLARGHVLLEGVPGLAKTLTVKTLAQVVDLDFQRIQFTPDLLPADLIGTLIYDQHEQRFVARKGPVFTQMLLADEINRAPAKVQSALLEVMEERQVTLGDRTSVLDEPFMVLATQNPIEHEGTYPLAEAQIDRFMLKLRIGYPERSEEEAILDRMLVEQDLTPQPILRRKELLDLRRVVDGVYLDPRVRAYVLDLVRTTREPAAHGWRRAADLIEFGASPRASLFLARAAKAIALIHSRGFVLPEDVKEMAPEILRHRLVLTYEAEAEETTSDDLIAELLQRVQVP